MANKTIPQLPLQTGITDNDLLAIVDSGETTTSRIKVSTLLSSAGGGAFQTGDATDSIVPAYSPTSRGVVANTTYVDKLNVNLTNALDIDNGTNNSSVTIGGFGTRTISGAGLGSAFVGGRNAQISGNANFSAGQFGSSIAGENNGMVGGRGNFITGGEYSFLGGGRSNVTSNLYNGILGGQNNNVSARHAAIIGGLTNTVSGFESVVVGGNQNDITGPVSGIFAGAGSDITGGQFCAIIAGNVNDINSNAAFSCIIGGTSNVTDHYRSVVVGGTGLSTAQNDEVVVPDLRFPNYASMNFANDTAAAAAGVLLGQVYHNAGDLRIRIT